MSWSPHHQIFACTLGACLGPEGLSFSSSFMLARWCWRKRESLVVSGAVMPTPSPPRGLARGSSDAVEPRLNPSTGIPVLAGTGPWAGSTSSLEPGSLPAGRCVQATALASLPCLWEESPSCHKSLGKGSISLPPAPLFVGLSRFLGLFLLRAG